MRIVSPDDQGFVRRDIETLGEDEAIPMPDVDVGGAQFSRQSTNLPVLVRMRQPASNGECEELDSFQQLEEVHATAKP